MIKVALKDLKLFFANKRATLLTFAVPIILISLFAYAFGGVGREKGEARPTKLVVADEDNSTESKDVIAKLDSLKEFEVMQTSAVEAEELVKKGDEPAVLVFHKGFSDSLNAGARPSIEFKYDAAKEAEVGILRGALTGQLMGLVGAKSLSKSVLGKFDSDNPDLDPKTRKQVHAQIADNFSSKETIKQSESMLKVTPLIAQEENSPGLVHAVAGTAIMMLLFSVSGMGASMLDEKQEGTLKKLMYSPLSPNSILLEK